MIEKKIVIGIVIISCAIFLFSAGYSIGYYEGVKDTTEEVLTMFEEISEQLANITSPQNTVLQNTVLEPWNASWTSRRCINNETKEYLYYTSNCSEKQINDFIKGGYYKGNYYAYTFYDDFSGCYITIQNETKNN